MSIYTAGKIGAALSGVIIVPTSVYLSRDYISFYEVERKVMNEDVCLSVENVDSSDSSLTVKIKTEDGDIWKPDGPYYWECVISADSSLSISKTELENKIPTDSSHKSDKNRNQNKRRLVHACSKLRTEFSSNSVKSSFNLKTQLDNFFVSV